MPTWLDASSATLAELWPGSVDYSPETVTEFLAAARAQVEAFAPTLADPDDVPGRYALAQALQARAIARATTAGDGGQMGGDGLTLTIFPMDWSIKALIRPVKGRPVIA